MPDLTSDSARILHTCLQPTECFLPPADTMRSSQMLIVPARERWPEHFRRCFRQVNTSSSITNAQLYFKAKATKTCLKDSRELAGTQANLEQGKTSKTRAPTPGWDGLAPCRAGMETKQRLGCKPCWSVHQLTHVKAHQCCLTHVERKQGEISHPYQRLLLFE